MITDEDMLEEMRQDADFYKHAAAVAGFIAKMLEEDYLSVYTVEAIAHVQMFADTMQMFVEVAGVQDGAL